MARDRDRSRKLRQLADKLMAQVPETFFSASAADLSTSLVRQWLTGDGHATLIFGPQQHYFRVRFDTNGEVRLDLHLAPIAPWFSAVARDWEIDEEELHKAVGQMNLGQSAQVENRRGEPLRLSLNAKERRHSIEALGPRHKPATRPAVNGPAMIAREHIEHLFADRISPAAKKDLVASLLRQWGSNAGHAVLVAPTARFHIILTSRAEGGSQVTCKKIPSNLLKKLQACGCTHEKALELVDGLNRGQTPEIIDERGRRCRIFADPRTARVCMIEVPSPVSNQASNQFIVHM